MKNIRNAIVFTLIFALCAACAKPPQEDMDNAAAALARAESDTDVMSYAASELARARDAYARMQAEADAKRYDEAKRLAQETIALAERAVQSARNAVVRAREEAEGAIAIMENAISEASLTIENARVSRERSLNFDEIDRDFTAARSTADDARSAVSSKRYREAIETSASVRNTLSGITGRIGQTVISASRKK